MDMLNILKDQSHVYDLTKVLDESTPVFPGDPAFKREKLCIVNDICGFTMQHLHFCNHAGTHIDFPAHVIKDGKNSSDFGVQDFIGSCIIIDYKDIIQNDTVSEECLNEITMPEFVFFKNASYLNEQVAEFLIQKKVKMVGVDALSVDAIDNHSLTIHNMLLRENILIVENLFLYNAPCGECFVVVAPLNITNIDGVPVRVIMWRQ